MCKRLVGDIQTLWELDGPEQVESERKRQARREAMLRKCDSSQCLLCCRQSDADHFEPYIRSDDLQASVSGGPGGEAGDPLTLLLRQKQARGGGGGKAAGLSCWPLQAQGTRHEGRVGGLGGWGLGALPAMAASTAPQLSDEAAQQQVVPQEKDRLGVDANVFGSGSPRSSADQSSGRCSFESTHGAAQLDGGSRMAMGPEGRAEAREAEEGCEGVPQTVPVSTAQRQEAYMVRENWNDTRDKVISGIDFRSVGGYFGAATSCKELCIHKLSYPETSSGAGDGEGKGAKASAAGTVAVDARWVHRTPGKLSALAWNNNSNIVTVGDHYGELLRIDVETGHVLCEVDEGSSVSILDLKRNKHFEHCRSLLTATKAGSVKLWSEDLSDAMTVCARSSVPVCGVAFSPLNPFGLAMALADASIAVWDVRHTEAPLFRGNAGGDHAVAHVEYTRGGDLVCSTLNHGISLWRDGTTTAMAMASAQPRPSNPLSLSSLGSSPGSGLKRMLDDAAAGDAPVAPLSLHKCYSFGGHLQRKHFVGLAVNERDFIATGSEDGKAFVYKRGHSAGPVAVCSDLDHSLKGGASPVTAVEWVPGKCAGFDSGADEMDLLVASGSCINRFRINAC